MKRREHDTSTPEGTPHREVHASDQAERQAQQSDGTDQRLADEQPDQRERERERERRVSNADASYNGPATATRTPKHVIPQ